MLFPTLTFYLFFVAVFIIVWAEHDNEWRKIQLLVASLIFYGAWDSRFVALLILSGVVNWAIAELILRAQGKPDASGAIPLRADGTPMPCQPGVAKVLLLAGVVANLGILALFKYYGFFMEQLIDVLHAAGWSRDITIMAVILPIGVSFFTFQGMSYQIDVYKGEARPASLLDMILLMSFFPHLVAGPIVRARHLIPQFQTTPKLTRGMAATGLALILWGLFKKTVIASQLATEFVDPMFIDPAAHGSLALLLGAYGYAVQIYCDFSGYSDMAVGLAALLGYRFPWNFDQPYRAASLQEFWRRWHISLSQWLRDYLYIALGGSRHGKTRMYLALMTTMLLGGLWHGASWNFVIWGALHGAAQVVEKAWHDLRPRAWPPLPRWLRVALTFHFVTLAWIFFRAAEFGEASAFVGGILSFRSGAIMASPLNVALIALGLAIHFAPANGVRRAGAVLRGWPAPAVAAACVVVLVVLQAMAPDGVAPFIYYKF